MKEPFNPLIIKQAIKACFAIDENLPKHERGDHNLEDLQQMPALFAVGFARMHGFSQEVIMSVFDIEFEEEYFNKLKYFSTLMAQAARKARSRNFTPFEKRFVAKADIVHKYILDAKPKEFFPIENLV